MTLWPLAFEIGLSVKDAVTTATRGAFISRFAFSLCFLTSALTPLGLHLGSTNERKFASSLCFLDFGLLPHFYNDSTVSKWSPREVQI